MGFDNQVIMLQILKGFIEVFCDFKFFYSEFLVQFFVFYVCMFQKFDVQFSFVFECVFLCGVEFFVCNLVKVFQKFFDDNVIFKSDVDVFKIIFQFLIDVFDMYVEGQKVCELIVIIEFLNMYVEVECFFFGCWFQDEEVILQFCDQNKEDIFKVVQIVLLYIRVVVKNLLVFVILEEYCFNKFNVGNVGKYFCLVFCKMVEFEFC